MIKSRGPTSNSTFWGDFCLTRDLGLAGAPTRNATGWQLAERSDSGSLWFSPANNDWRGFPLEQGDTPEWRWWLLGELYGLNQASTVATRIRAALEDGNKIRQLNGHFLLIARRKTDDSWHLWTNRFGSVHAYWCDRHPQRVISSFFGVVHANAKRALDWPAINAFLSCDFFPGLDTFCEDIKLLGPASHLYWSGQGSSQIIKRYWHWQYQPEAARDEAETLTELAKVLSQVTEDLTAQGRIALPISGGLDSRTSLAALADSFPNERLWAFSYGYENHSPELRIGARVAHAAERPHQSLVIQPYLFEELPAIQACLEGFQDVTQCRQASIAAPLAAQADAVIAAHWGDVWFDRVWSKSGGSFLDQASKKFIKQGSSWLQDHLSAPQLAIDPRTSLHQTIARECAAFQDIDDPEFRLKAFKTDQWSFRWTLSSLRMYQRSAFPRLLFYDQRVTDFFATVPHSLLSGRNLQIAYLKRFAPKLARVVWQETDTNLFAKKPNGLLRLPRRIAKAVWRRTLGRPILARNWEVQLATSQRHHLERALLKPGLCVHDLVDPRKIRQLIEAFYHDPETDKKGRTVCMLLTLSQWLETYG